MELVSDADAAAEFVNSVCASVLKDQKLNPVSK